MTVMAQVWRDPDKVRDGARHVCRELAEGNDLRRARASVIGERVVLQRVRIRTLVAAIGHTFHVGAPLDARAVQLGAEATGRERMESIVGDAPRTAGSEREVVG